MLTTFGVAIASGALVSMVAFALGLQSQAERPFQKLGLLNNVEVFAKDDEKSGPSPVLDDAALERIAKLPKVLTTYPDFRAAGLKVIHDGHTNTSMAVALPREAALVGMLEDILVAGVFFQTKDTAEAILGKGLTDKLGFKSPQAAVGARIKLEAAGLTPDQEQTFRFQRKEFEVTVAGVYESPSMAPRFAGEGLLLPVDLMKEIPGISFAPALQSLRSGRGAQGSGYAKAIARVEHPRDLSTTEKAIQEMGFRTRTLLKDLTEMRTFFVFIDLLLAAVGTVALVVASLGIINTLVMAVLERYQEIGIYKAIGASDTDLRILFLTEAACVGFFGGMGGLVLGKVVAWILDLAAHAYARRMEVTMDFSLFTFPWWLLIGTVLFAMVISILAGVYPASRAARVDPILALRGL